MSKDSFANRFQIALNKANLKQVDICSKTNFSSGLINKYLSGKAVPRQKRLYILAQILNVNPAWLIGFNVPYSPMPSHIEENTFNDNNKIPLEEKKNDMVNHMKKYNIDSLFPIPVYSEVRKDMFETGDKYINEYIPINPTLYNISASEQYFYIKIFDDSMNLKYKQGDYILMQKTSKIQNNNISLILVDKSILIRKITKQGSLILLEPISNNAEYKTQAYAKDKIQVLGVVIGYMGKE